MYTLFGSQGCGSASAQAALERTGAPFRVVRASSWEPDSAVDELARLNPLKQIPAQPFLDGATLERIEQHPWIAPVLARHWPG